VPVVQRYRKGDIFNLCIDGFEDIVLKVLQAQSVSHEVDAQSEQSLKHRHVHNRMNNKPQHLPLSKELQGRGGILGAVGR